MNFRRAPLALGALISALWLATPAFAVTYYCDNDPVGYPCGTGTPRGWSYGRYHGDKNGDHRQNSSGGSYQWIFNRDLTQTYNFYAWLANPSFTDTAAQYFYYD